MKKAMYTIETLKEINLVYDAQHKVTQSDVDMANNWVDFIESSRDDKAPQVGDIVELTTKHGAFFENAHIEIINYTPLNKLNICEIPYVPFVGISRDKLATSTSGGAWYNIPSNLKLIGKREKFFNDWGHCHACGNGAVKFAAIVNAWEYKEPGNLYGDFSTKNYDCFHVSIRKEFDDYKYLVSKNSISHAAFRTDAEYQAWLKTFSGVEFEGYNSNTKVVWTYKQTEKCIPIEEYNKIEHDYKDNMIYNGSIQECKRKQAGTTITTFLPYQNNSGIGRH